MDLSVWRKNPMWRDVKTALLSDWSKHILCCVSFRLNIRCSLIRIPWRKKMEIWAGTKRADGALWASLWSPGCIQWIALSRTRRRQRSEMSLERYSHLSRLRVSAVAMANSHYREPSRSFQNPPRHPFPYDPAQ